MSVFEVSFHRKAGKDLLKLPKKMLIRVYDLVKSLETDPVPRKKFDISKLRGRNDAYRVRMGQYRIMYIIDSKNNEIIIQKISTREKAYTSDD